jgi:hypothetical protein
MGWVLDWATRRHWTVYHTHDSRHSAAGFPDLVLVRPPSLIFAELKTDSARSRLSAAQLRWIDLLEGCGAETYVWRPADRPEIHERLR